MVERWAELMEGLELNDVVYEREIEGKPVRVLDRISLSIESGEFVAIIGPSGCGKSTMLQLFTGLLPVSSGSLKLRGNLISGVQKETGLVFQEPRLFPWLTIQQNVEWGICSEGAPKKIRREIARELLCDVGLVEWSERHPHELSLGMQKRVSIARVLAKNCQVLLLDEPFSALDYQTRILMQRYLVNLHRVKRKTILLVTHEIDEALLADRVIVMSARPARVVTDLTVKLPRPRDKSSPAFQNLSLQLTSLLEREVLSQAKEEESWQTALNAEAVWAQPKWTERHFQGRA